MVCCHFLKGDCNFGKDCKKSHVDDGSPCTFHNCETHRERNVAWHRERPPPAPVTLPALPHPPPTTVSLVPVVAPPPAQFQRHAARDIAARTALMGQGGAGRGGMVANAVVGAPPGKRQRMDAPAPLVPPTAVRPAPPPPPGPCFPPPPPLPPGLS
eukprot:gene4602-32500_t